MRGCVAGIVVCFDEADYLIDYVLCYLKLQTDSPSGTNNLMPMFCYKPLAPPGQYASSGTEGL